MTRDGCSRPYSLGPCDTGAPYEPLVSIADFEFFLTLKLPFMRGKASCFEYFFSGAHFFPRPTAICGGRIIPPFLVSNVTAVDPFYPERIFFVGNGPDEFGNGGLIPGSEVLDPYSSMLLSSTRIDP